MCIVKISVLYLLAKPIISAILSELIMKNTYKNSYKLWGDFRGMELTLVLPVPE